MISKVILSASDVLTSMFSFNLSTYYNINSTGAVLGAPYLLLTLAFFLTSQRRGRGVFVHPQNQKSSMEIDYGDTALVITNHTQSLVAMHQCFQ